MKFTSVLLLHFAACLPADAQEARYRKVKGHLLPDAEATPGVRKPAADTATICARGYTSLPGVRHVTESTKKQVYELYGATKRGQAMKKGACCEVDHLISLELGGANDIRNLWPEPYPDATVKDKTENALHHLVCSGRLNLKVAQRGIAGNWVAFRDSLMSAGTWVGAEVENRRSQGGGKPRPSAPGK